DAELWRELASRFTDAASAQEMAWERADGIWGPDWKTAAWREVAKRYARAATKPTSVAKEAAELAARARTSRDVRSVRELYLKSRRYAALLAELAEFKLDELRATVRKLHGAGREGRRLLARLDELEGQATRWEDGPPSGGAFETWKAAVKALRRDAIFNQNPLIDFDKLVFIKRLTYSANHYYTEYVNSRWTPGGGLCILDLKTGDVKEIATELEDGVFMRFDVSFDAKRIVFDWKCDAQQGYRIYEIGVDGTGLRQLTFPQDDDAELVRKYRVAGQYHHGTDDMHPCYLPDGGICFISTRCQYGILCDAPDNFSTTILYRMDADGRNMRPLSNSSVSEASPAVLPDGRIMYTRWEYVDKGAVSVKCLWAMRPDGTASAEIYANDISLPPTFIYGRPIPGVPNGYVVLGTPHYPNNGLGTVIRLDMSRDIRSRDPMTYMTPYIDIRGEGGFSVKENGRWRRDDSAPLFRDPYPLSKEFYLVAHKPQGTNWRDQKAYGIYLLDETGGVQLVHKDPEISCWQPFPLRPRTRPPVLESPVDERMAAKGLATCVVTDIYHGMEDTPRGSIKHIRVLEQIPRPWATRRRWGGDGYDQQHATITKDTHLGLKVQHGVVPVEDDGSAHFVVPAMTNIILQALDENYMAVQTERTYVNYMAGESRSCIGCHETPNDAAAAKDRGVMMALRRAPSVPGPQPGEKRGKRPLDFAMDVQPVLDKHCIKCHSGEKPKAGLDLSGTMTRLFSVSYENLIPERRGGKGRSRRRFELVGPTIGENHPKTGNIHYMPARSFGSHNSVLVAMHSKGKVRLKDPEKAEIAERLAEKHKDVKLSREELLKITNWVDTNSQFYGMYWGRKNTQYRNHPNFRPVPTFERAASYVSQIPEGER
ncbi:MAG: HzsA-related protein, partial [Planctomycetota bacterium]